MRAVEPDSSEPAGSRAGDLDAPAWLPDFEVVHALPGRLRLKLEAADASRSGELAEWLARQPAVHSVRHTAAARSITVTFDRDVRPRRLFAEAAPAPARARTPSSAMRARPWRRFLLPAASLAFGLVGTPWIAVPAIALCGVPLARRAAENVVRRRLGIELLDAAGIVLLLGIGDLFAAGASLALIEVGERIRKEARGRARRVLRTWMAADGAGVRLLEDVGERRVPPELVRPGQRAVVYAGETVPVDGTVLAGDASIDNRSWTGEWAPVSARPGSRLLAGASLIDGRLVIDVAASGEETRAGRLAAALEDAIAADTRVADLAKRTADRFVLPVLAATALVFGATRDVSRLVAMLVIDFGSGVRISIPTAILTTMVRAAREQVLFKSGKAIEELSTVDVVVFDKTGTLTEGRPEVYAVDPAAGSPVSVDEAIRLAASAEGEVQHPVAAAVRRAAARRGLPPSFPERFTYQVGGGVNAVVGGRRVLVGDRRLLLEQGVAIPAGWETGSSVCFVAVDGVLAAGLKLRDRIRTRAAAAVLGLRELGVRRVVLATGDNARVAHSIASRLGVDEVHAGLMPEDKTRLIESLAQAGHRVAVVGDGINDAAAMAAAAVGIAVSGGTDLARETADVVLLGEDLRLLETALRLSRDAMRIIRQNIALSAAPNGAALALAGAGRLSPLAASFIHNGATLAAAGNALRPLRLTASGPVSDLTESPRKDP